MNEDCFSSKVAQIMEHITHILTILTALVN
jgi:hypothetical protein